MRRPLVNLCLAFMIGILLAEMGLPDSLALAAGLLLALYVLGFSLPHSTHPKNWLFAVLLALVALLGNLRMGWITSEYTHDLEVMAGKEIPHPAIVSGILAEEFTRTAGNHWSTRLKDPALWDGTHWCVLPGGVEILAITQTQPLGKPGQWVEFSGKWKAVDAPGIPGEIDSRHWGLSRNIVGMIYSSHSPRRCIEPSVLSFADQLRRLRSTWRSHIRGWMFERLPHDAAGLTLAMTTGERGFMDSRMRQDLLTSGLLHLTAISGLNVTIALLVLPMFLKVFGIPRHTRALAGIPLALLLFFLVGDQVSVMRATLMGITAMLGIWLDRQGDGLNFLAGAGLVILSIDPTELFQAGFLMSFMTVALLLAANHGEWSIISWRMRFDKYLQKWIPPTFPVFSGTVHVVERLMGGLWISFLATLAVAPISALYFHSISWKGIFANLAAVPLAEMLTVFGILVAFGIGWIPGIGWVAAQILSWTSWLLICWVEWVASWPFGFHRVYSPDLVQWVALAGIFPVLVYPWRPLRSGRFKARLALLLLLLAATWWPCFTTSKTMKVHFFDIGQGDACLIEFPGGENLLVDTGPPLESSDGTSPLVKALLELGVHRLEGVVLSHPEQDHAGGLTNILETIPVDCLYASGDVNESPEFRAMAEALAASSIPFERILSGDTIQGIQDATITVLHPSPEDLKYQSGTRNDRSIVLKVECRGLSLLLTGDIGADHEMDLVEKGHSLIADVLKVPHHGSAYSSSEKFLQAVQPSVSIISCGENRFGHPSPETLQRLEKQGSRVFVTRYDGTVHLEWDGSDLNVFTWKNREARTSLK